MDITGKVCLLCISAECVCFDHVGKVVEGRINYAFIPLKPTLCQIVAMVNIFPLSDFLILT